jgi:hypothetical protein
MACALPLLLGAGCNQDSTESEPSVGQVERTNTMTAANLAFVTAGEGTATLVGRLINDGEQPDRLVDVDAESEQGPLDVRLVGEPVAVQPTEPVRLGPEPSVVAELQGMQPGLRVELELSFERSAPISTTVTVESQTGPYADIEVPG